MAHRFVGLWAACFAPPSFATRGPFPCAPFWYAEALQKSRDGFGPFEAFEANASEFAAHPCPQLLQVGFTFGEPKVGYPPAQETVEFGHHLFEGDVAAVAPGYRAYALFGAIETHRGDSQFAAAPKTVAEELAFLDKCHRAFRPVDPQSEFGLDESCHAFEHAFACHLSPHIYVAVVGVPAELVPSAFQFLIEIVEQQVGQNQ